MFSRFAPLFQPAEKLADFCQIEMVAKPRTFLFEVKFLWNDLSFLT